MWPKRVRLVLVDVRDVLLGKIEKSENIWRVLNGGNSWAVPVHDNTTVTCSAVCNTAVLSGSGGKRFFGGPPIPGTYRE